MKTGKGPIALSDEARDRVSEQLHARYVATIVGRLCEVGTLDLAAADLPIRVVDRPIDDFRTDPSLDLARYVRDVLVDRAYTEVAAAGHGDRCLTEAAEQRAEQIVARADLAREVIAGLGRVDAVAVDLHGVLVEDLHLRAHVLENSEQERHVADLRDVFDAAHAVDEQSGRNDGDCGIFRAADLDLPVQGSAAMYYISIQTI